MLQQTQVARVIPAWTSFLEEFPTPAACATAPLAQVLRAWQGMGFARRARYLHECAKTIANVHGGLVPPTVTELRALPGIGAYTAHAVASFAFHEPVAVLDTNVGRVVARAIANRRLTAREAQEVATELLPTSDSAQWNQLMLDLGAQFCKSKPLCEACPVQRHCRWRQRGGDDPAIKSGGVSQPQSKFAGSTRQQRGLVLRALGLEAATKRQLLTFDGIDAARLDDVLAALTSDGLISRRGPKYQLPGDYRPRNSPMR